MAECVRTSREAAKAGKACFKTKEKERVKLMMARIVILIRMVVLVLMMVTRLIYQHHHSHDRQPMMSFIP